jgi:hypothetical protein
MLLEIRETAAIFFELAISGLLKFEWLASSG